MSQRWRRGGNLRKGTGEQGRDSTAGRERVNAEEEDAGHVDTL